MIDLLTGMLTTAVLAGGILALAGLGELLAERVGVFNLGLEGLMSLGAVTAVIAVNAGASPIAAVLAACALGLALGAGLRSAPSCSAPIRCCAGLRSRFWGSGSRRGSVGPIGPDRAR